MATTVPNVEQMTDNALCQHLMKRHGEDIAMDLDPAEEGKPRVLRARIVWDTYHARLHATKKHDDHEHIEVKL
jgi:hypothetical protein